MIFLVDSFFGGEGQRFFALDDFEGAALVPVVAAGLASRSGPTRAALGACLAVGLAAILAGEPWRLGSSSPNLTVGLIVLTDFLPMIITANEC